MTKSSERLTDQQRHELRCLLDEQQKHLGQLLREYQTQAQPIGLDLPIGRLSRMDALQQQHMAAGQQRRLELELQRIKAALNRIDRQQYGLCLRCGESIPYGRLVIRPTTTLCFECQAEREARQGEF